MTDSVIHALDPRTKIVGTFVYIVSLFLARSLLSYLLAALLLLVMIALSNVPVGFMVRGLRPVLVLLMITMVFNVLLTPGETLYRIGMFRITREGLLFALTMGVRLVFLVIGSSIMTLTTTPSSLCSGLESLMQPLKVVGVPVAGIAMMMSIALRFIPILSEEADRIVMAQKARGAIFDQGGIIKRARALLPLIIPLFLSAFRRSNELALAMDARCYSEGVKRTKLRPLSFHGKDMVAFAVMTAYLAFMVAVRVLNR